jgi:aminoethylphosphonate catabolism LysR family transcriptional regulator
MNLAHLRAFQLVARAGGFSRAAAAARVSQPTLSAQVKALERSYGVTLFDRRGRQVRLTRLGRRLLGVADRLFALADEAEAVVAGTDAPASTFLSVAADGPAHALSVLAALEKRVPGLDFALAIGNSEEVVRGVLAYESDIGIIGRAVADPRLSVVRIKRHRLVAFAPAGGRRRHPTLAQAASERLVLRERGSATRERFEAALAQAGLAPSRTVEVATREGVREAVAAGFGLGIVFESELGPDPRFRALPFADAHLEVAEYACCLAERRDQPLLRAFVDCALANPSAD